MRRVLKVLKWILLGLLLLAASWVAFNGPWADAPARPRPAALIQKPLQVVGPGAYALLVGQPMRIDITSQPPWQCGSRSTTDCSSVWLAQSAALREQLKAAGAFASTCEAAATQDVDWTEPEVKLPAVNPAAAPIPQLKNIGWCVRWLRAQATLAIVDGNDERALRYLQRADKAVRGALDGAQSLIGHAVAWSMASQQWQTVAVLAHARPQLASRLQPLLLPLNPAALSTARWISTESAFSQAILRDLRRSCDAAIAGAEEAAEHGWLASLWCHGRLGFLPELTAQEVDAQFLTLTEQTRGGVVAAAAGRLPGSEPEPGAWAWRNTIGHPLVAVARPQWASYIERQADVELLRQAAELAVRLTIGPLPADRRQAWLDAQAIPPAIKSRLSLTGDALIVRTWQQAGDKPEPLSFALPGATGRP